MPNHQGIVSSAINKPQQPADQFKAPEIKPVTTQVDAPKETVEGRVNDMTAKGSRYTTLAATDAKREANSLGLVNSTMAAAAGTEAAIRSALPIAQQDAKTYTDTRKTNQAVENKFLENRQGANLNQEVAAQGSRLKKSEAVVQSGLTSQENTLLNQLQMKRDNNASSLTQAEQAQLNALQIKRDQSSAQLNQDTAAFQSGLTQAENAQLNQLQMKRDQGLSTLTQAEQAQLSQLQIKRDSAQSGNIVNQQAAQSGNVMNQQAQANQLAINRDALSAGLNESLVRLENVLKQSNMTLDASLKLSLEQTLQDGRFSDQVKINAMNAIENIYANLQSQITQVGLSDRTGPQQAEAIKMLRANAVAETATYQALLNASAGWDFGNVGTGGAAVPGSSGGGGSGAAGAAGGTSAAPTSYPTYPTDPAQIQKLESDVAGGFYTDQAVAPSGTVKYSGNPAPAWESSDGKWRWQPDIGPNPNRWIPGSWPNF